MEYLISLYTAGFRFYKSWNLGAREKIINKMEFNSIKSLILSPSCFVEGNKDHSTPEEGLWEPTKLSK
jgi:hypothetical protein